LFVDELKKPIAPPLPLWISGLRL